MVLRNEAGIAEFLHTRSALEAQEDESQDQGDDSESDGNKKDLNRRR